MRGGTHALAGVLVGIVMTNGQPLGGVVGAVIAGALGALAPDLDHPQATLSRRVGLLAAPVRLFVRHRGVLHSGAAAALLLALAAAAPLLWRQYALSAAVGYSSHILLDAMTIQGVPLLWPSARRFRLLTLTTGGIVERLFTVAMFTALLMLGVKLL